MIGTDRDTREWFLSGVQYAIGLIALVWFVSQLSVAGVVGLLHSLSIGSILLLIAVTVGGQIFMYLLWHLLFVSFQPTSFADTARVSLASNFVNVTVPSRVPALVLNPLIIRHHTGLNSTAAVTVTFVHTLLFAGLYALVATVGLVVAATHLSLKTFVFLAIAIGVYALAALLGIISLIELNTLSELIVRARRASPFDIQISNKNSWNKSITGDIREQVISLLTNWHVLSLFTLIWLCGLVLPSGIRVGVLFFISGYEFTPIWLLPAVVVTTYSVTILPVSVGGIGVAEITASILFVSLGYPIDVVAPIILLDRLLGKYIPGVIGFVPAMSVDFYGS